MKILLEDAYKKIVNFLNKEKAEYIIIGGIAAGTLGEPRVTGDVDIDIFIEQGDVVAFLKKLKKDGFGVNEQRCVTMAGERGVFQINYGDFHVDFIIASIDLEKEALKRRKKIKLYNIKAFFPTPEDLILLKIIPGRAQDLLDAQRVLVRQREKLDIKYLESWARKLSEEAQDMRIWNALQKILKDKEADI